MSDSEEAEVDEEELARINKVKSTPAPSISLHSAARINDIKRVKQLLEEKTEGVDDIDVYGKTALHYAADRGLVDMIKFLLEQGADINKPGHMEQTPLHLASIKGARVSAKTIVESGKAELDKADAAGNTALLYACRNGSLRIAELLLGAGADLGIKNNHGAGALHFAVLGLAEPVTQMLIERGIDMQKLDKADQTALHWAVKIQDPNMVKCLKDCGVDVNKINKVGKKAIEYAAKYEKEKIDEILGDVTGV